jgi:SAM-dependent methyltransferase
MREEDRRAVVERYAQRYRAHGYDPLTLGWTKGRERVRYAAAIEALERFDSLLDVGCGFGDLYAFLSEGGWRGRYLGIDVVPELLEEARRRHAGTGADFQLADISGDFAGPEFDVAVAIGVFNHVTRQPQLELIAEVLDVMRRWTRVAVVADFLSASAERRYPNCAYASAADIAALALARSKRFSLNHRYMPFEFNVVIWKDDSFDAAWPAFAQYRRHAKA